MMQLDLSTPWGITVALAPEVLLTLWSLVVLLVVSWRHTTEQDSRLAGWLSFVGVLLAGAGVAGLWVNEATSAGLAQMVALDPFRYGASAIILLAAAGTILLSLGYLEREQLLAPEYYPLVLLATAGMLFLAGAEDLIVLFLGLEVMSVAVYVLAGYNRRNVFSSEAALKYFLIGAFASGFLLYGIALMYGLSGTTNLSLIGAQLAGRPLPLMGALGLGLLLIGFAFKVSAVPFHMWSPDVYDGSPTPVTAFMATGVKAAAFAALVRVLLESFPSAERLWQPVIAALAIASMVVGNLVALAQRPLKRMLAYSSIGHAGYLLVALAADTPQASTAVVFYLLIYTLATFGAFAVVSALARPGEGTLTLDEMSGLWYERPWLATAMAVFMLALLGFPIFGGAGFFAKWYVLQAALDAPRPQTGLAVALVLTTVVSAGYYLYVVMVMFMRARPDGALPAARAGGFTRAIIAATAVLILVLGVAPDLAVRAARVATPRIGVPVSASTAEQDPTAAR
jgi:NADH-quinone oxidoreductase subunit N